jgi:sec-independent protein translocase protein TatC
MCSEVFDELERKGGIIENAGPSPVVALKFTEQFFLFLTLLTWLSLVLSTPFVLYHLWRFAGAGLPREEQRRTLRYLPASIACYVVSIFVCYLVLVPAVLALHMPPDSSLSALLEAAPPITFYPRLLLLLTATSVAMFQVPLIMVFSTTVRLVRPVSFSHLRPWAYLTAFVVGAAVTPPDVPSQMLMAVALVSSFEVGFLLSRSASTA